MPPRPWYLSPSFWLAVLVGVLLRAAPLWIWGWAGDDCTRDECIFKIAARPILAGDGLGLAPKGWLPAPGFPYLLAASKVLFGHFESIKWVQVALTLPLLASIAAIGDRLGGRRAALVLAWMLAVHPTFVFFAGTMWTETVYTALLLPTTWGLLWARDGEAKRAAWVGLGLGLCILNRGIATALAPIMLIAIVAPDPLLAPWSTWRAAIAARARHAIFFLAAVVATVAPYSLNASARWGGFVISDATIGHVVAMGNDDYPPLTFDYGIGQLTGPLFARTEATGRRPCPHDDGPVAYDRCEVARGIAWIKQHPTEFVARVPMRWGQLVNPHSFLSRHLLWNYWYGMPWELRQLLVVLQVATSWIVIGGGGALLWLRARGPIGWVTIATCAYYLALIGSLYGLTRFRLPLEPLLMIPVGLTLAAPSDTLAVARAAPWRVVAAAATFVALSWLMSMYVASGFPGL